MAYVFLFGEGHLNMEADASIDDVHTMVSGPVVLDIAQVRFRSDALSDTSLHCSQHFVERWNYVRHLVRFSLDSAIRTAHSRSAS